MVEDQLASKRDREVYICTVSGISTTMRTLHRLYGSQQVQCRSPSSILQRSSGAGLVTSVNLTLTSPRNVSRTGEHGFCVRICTAKTRADKERDRQNTGTREDVRGGRGSSSGESTSEGPTSRVNAGAISACGGPHHQYGDSGLEPAGTIRGACALYEDKGEPQC